MLYRQQALRIPLLSLGLLRDGVHKTNSALLKESSPQSSAQTTPSHGLTPTTSQGHALLRDTNPTPTSATVPKGGNNKRNKKSQEKDDDESDGKPPKRLKITYARGDKGD